MNQDFRDLLRGFCDQHVEFLVVGAYAMAVHGVPRATGDIDVWPRHQTARFGDVDVPVLSFDDLIVNKAATGRPKDLLDRDSLLASRRK